MKHGLVRTKGSRLIYLATQDSTNIILIIAMYVCEAKTHARVTDVEPAIKFETLNAIEQELMMGSKGV